MKGWNKVKIDENNNIKIPRKKVSIFIEKNLQIHCVSWFKYFKKLNRLNHRLLCINNNSENAIIGKINKDLGVEPGASDLIFITDKKTLYIELKVNGNSQSDAQLSFEHDIKLLGHEYYIIDNFNDFVKLIQDSL